MADVPPVEYLLVGHVTHDLLPQGGYTVGGTASYAALTASALGRRVGVLTSAGQDFDPALFKDVASLVCLPSPVTTTFENLYLNGHREQFAYSVARPLTVAHIPQPWRAVPLVHIGPVIGECDPSLVSYFAGRAFVGVTPQGWMRSVDAEGHVHRRPWREAEQVLPLASAVVLSIEDIEGEWRTARAFAEQTHILVVTTAARGGVLFVDGDEEPFGALAVEEVDPTGAGDIFATAFFIALATGALPYNAANFAACLASLSVTRRGLEATPRPEDVRTCVPPWG